LEEGNFISFAARRTIKIADYWQSDQPRCLMRRHISEPVPVIILFVRSMLARSARRAARVLSDPRSELEETQKSWEVATN
jgi:hypothetical protein